MNTEEKRNRRVLEDAVGHNVDNGQISEIILLGCFLAKTVYLTFSRFYWLNYLTILINRNCNLLTDERNRFDLAEMRIAFLLNKVYPEPLLWGHCLLRLLFLFHFKSLSKINENVGTVSNSSLS